MATGCGKLKRQSRSSFPDCSDLAVFGVGIALVRHDFSDRFDDRLAVSVLLHPSRVPILDGMLVIAKFERTANGLEVRLEHGGAERIGIADVTLQGFER